MLVTVTSYVIEFALSTIFVCVRAFVICGVLFTLPRGCYDQY